MLFPVAYIAVLLPRPSMTALTKHRRAPPDTLNALDTVCNSMVAPPPSMRTALQGIGIHRHVHGRKHELCPDMPAH